MTIEWYDSSKALPTVTLASYGITLNTSAADYLKGNKRIKLGVHVAKKQLLLKPFSTDEEGSFALTEVGEKNKNVRISCKDFILYLSNKYNFDLTSSEKYYATWDEEGQMLVVDLSKKIQRSSRKKTIKTDGK